ncbi:surface antigen-domain-containing protein [Syncephalis pseudoplumigaleata]|uniref:Surface antigen-domain-containing protein n=1 Tax=Syncephalis pseudoplumigaleata TaxID=1712513 RepID=A0A4V1J1P4_9FUNG|nr:surface antigen-domain-containing protein [Syncephalis pseudoplumigaleata]|eukprot:RKP25769.1 surface antigen-domain-containing protein [Syncephalis pseudoplumigaleata]
MNAVLFRGVRHTRRSFLDRLATPILEAATFGEAIERTQTVVSRLGRLGICAGVAGELDRARGPLAKEKGIDALLTIRERNRLTIMTGTQIGDEEGSVNGSVTFRNAFGGAECFEANASMGTRTPSAFQASFTTPLASNPDHMASVHAYQTLRSKMMQASHNEMTRGATLRYEASGHCAVHWRRLGQHGIYYDIAWRNIYQLTDKASLAIRNDAGHTLRSALGHVLIRDRRNSSELPTDGYLLRVQNEVAGPGGDVHYAKCEVEGQWLQSLGRGFHASLTTRGGFIAPLAGDRLRVNDRFTLGGPVSLRGFKTFGMGPREDDDMVGGNIYYALGLSLFTPLPKVDSDRFKGHLFVNAGTLRLVEPGNGR